MQLSFIGEQTLFEDNVFKHEMSVFEHLLCSSGETLDKRHARYDNRTCGKRERGKQKKSVKCDKGERKDRNGGLRSKNGWDERTVISALVVRTEKKDAEGIKGNKNGSMILRETRWVREGGEQQEGPKQVSCL